MLLGIDIQARPPPIKRHLDKTFYTSTWYMDLDTIYATQRAEALSASQLPTKFPHLLPC